jgi:hypothetical protein
MGDLVVLVSSKPVAVLMKMGIIVVVKFFEMEVVSKTNFGA